VYAVRVVFAGLYGFSAILLLLTLVYRYAQGRRTIPILTEAVLRIALIATALVFSAASWILFRERSSMSGAPMRWPFIASVVFVLIFAGYSALYLYLGSGFWDVQRMFGAFQVLGLLGMWMFRQRPSG
jgi:hypothetical protein